MNEMVKKLSGVFESARGSMEHTHAVELLSFLGLLSKLDPAGFQAVVNTGSRHQHEAMNELGKQLSLKHTLPEGVLSAPEAHRLDEKVLADTLTLLTGVTDFTAFAQAVREFCCLNASRTWEMNCSSTSLPGLYKAILGDCSALTLFDGAAGLASVVSHLKPEHAILMEINHTTWLISYRLLLLEEQSMEFHRADALLASRAETGLADVAVIEPPLGIRLAADQRRELARVAYLQVPVGDSVSAMAADVLWLQLAMNQLKPQGTALLLMSQGWTFRPGYDAQVRQALLESEHLDALIHLPAGMIPGSAIPSVLVILKKERTRGAPVLLIDASDLGTQGRQGCTLSHEEITLITEWINGTRTSACCKPATLSEIRAQDYSLSIGRYIEKVLEVNSLDLHHEMKVLADIRQRFEQSQQALNAQLTGFKR